MKNYNIGKPIGYVINLEDYKKLEAELLALQAYVSKLEAKLKIKKESVQ